MRELDLALIGFGTVGQGLAELIIEKGDDLERSEGLRLRVVAISDFVKGSAAKRDGIDLRAALDVASTGKTLDELAADHHGWDALTTIRDAGADVVVEATYTDLETGGPAMDHISQALDRGLHVTTTNKGPVALAAHELMRLADERGVRFLFEGTVMSGTPTLSFARRNLAGCEVRGVAGIFNGTTNYILTEMESGTTYADALNRAQELGYAEAVPDADVEGHDTLGKVVILSNLLLGAELKPADVARQGITHVTSEMIAEARGRGERFKLLGRAIRSGDAVEASVELVAVGASDPLAGVSGATNAITFDTDLLGPVTVVGPGAGRRETGFALLADLIEIGRSIGD